jgi:tRNA(adenine34) deaminase
MESEMNRSEDSKPAIRPPGRAPGDAHGEDERWMRIALAEAARAGEQGEVPVGAVLVRDGVELARGHNRREVDADPTAHAEVVVLRAAAGRHRGWRLEGTTLYVTLEPCAMCAGALVNARVARLVFAARDPKAGFCGTLGDITQDPRLNHRLAVGAGVLADECAEQLQRFFAARR